MTELEEIRIGVQPLERFAQILSRKQMKEAVAVAQTLAARLSKRVSMPKERV